MMLKKSLWGCCGRQLQLQEANILLVNTFTECPRTCHSLACVCLTVAWTSFESCVILFIYIIYTAADQVVGGVFT